jgi:LmbE family N-acetylglucosaminyl deacetylase
MPNNFYVPTSALVIVAHPDDIEFSCAGTVARWTRLGAQVTYVLCTSGDAGIDEPGMTRAKATEIREAEQRRAAEIAGVHEVVFLRQPDGLLQPTLELRKMLVREIRRYRPEVVVTGDPTVLWAGDDYINHPDHRAAATAALDAAFPAAGQPHVFEELEEEGSETAQDSQSLCERLEPERPVRQYRRDHGNQARGAQSPQIADARLGALRDGARLGRRARQGQRDGLRRVLPRHHPGG